MRGRRQRKQLGSSGTLSTSMYVVGEEEEGESYRLTTVGEQVRKEIELRFHRSEVNAAYVFPRQDSQHKSNSSVSSGHTAPLSLLLKTQPQKLRLIRHIKANSVAKRPSKSPLKGKTPCSDSSYLPRLPSALLRRTPDSALDLRVKPRPNSRLFTSTKDLRRQQTAVRSLHDSAPFLSFYLD